VKKPGFVEITLASTEMIDGEKKRPGDKVTLPANHPVAVKTLVAQSGGKADDGGRD
jgi:hypothetical protein